MAIDVSVQYNGGFFPDIIMLTLLCDYIGEPFRYHEDFLSLQQIFPPKYFDNFPPEGGCSECLDTFRFFVNRVTGKVVLYNSIAMYTIDTVSNIRYYT